MSDEPLCGAPCVHGGRESSRRRSQSDLGWQGHCNRRVPNAGDRCWSHPRTDIYPGWSSVPGGTVDSQGLHLPSRPRATPDPAPPHTGPDAPYPPSGDA